MQFSTPIKITDYTNKTWSFSSLEAFESFIKHEADFWRMQSPTSQTPSVNQFIQCHNNFQQVINQLIAWQPNFTTWDNATSQGQISSLIIQQLNTNWLWSGHAVIEKWIELKDVSSNIADSFFEAIVQKTTSRFAQGMDYFRGYLIAYEYLNQDKTDINKRRNIEAKSLNQLRDQLVEKQNELIGDVNSFQEDLNLWKGDFKKDLDSWFEQQNKLSSQAFIDRDNALTSQMSEWLINLAQLEKRYREELRFESAAEFWGKKVTSFKTQGYSWAAGLCVFLLLGLCLFSKYFLTWLSGQPSGLGLQSIEGVLIFATILSSYAFLIKALSKMTFSSFHLMRDAEEREQLTHLYLNLREGKEDDPDSRKIILQALFSRSDSGLLAGDHSPTMPTVQDAIKIIKP